MIRLRELVNQLDLGAALVSASRRIDLLPPRPDQGAGGETGQAFINRIQYEIEHETYLAEPAILIAIPKRGLASRPAALLTLSDRMIYYALVDRLAPKVERRILGPAVVFAARATGDRGSWREFELSPLLRNPEYVVLADIQEYYASIPHQILLNRVVETTGDRLSAEALGELLQAVMGTSRGIPQGNRASDILATMLLDPVDRAMLRAGYEYVRYGDDVRIALDSFDQGRAAVARFEEELRVSGLALNEAKTRILKRATYESQLNELNEARDALKNRILEARREALRDQVEEAETLEELEGVLTDELLWDLYAGDISVEEVVDRMAPLLEPDITEIAEELFRDTMNRAWWKPNPLKRESFHGRLLRSLTYLTTARSLAAMNDIGIILYRLPDETKEVAQYLSAVSNLDRARVQATIERFLTRDTFRHDWQEAWLYEAAAKTLPLVPEFVQYRESIVQNEGRSWFIRTCALVLLAKNGTGDRRLLERAWQMAPAPFKADVIAAATWLETVVDWAPQFLEACRVDPVLDVVVAHVRNLRESESTDGGNGRPGNGAAAR